VCLVLVGWNLLILSPEKATDFIKILNGRKTEKGPSYNALGQTILEIKKK